MVIIQEHDFNVTELIANLHQKDAGQNGAILSFIGYVRDFNPEAPTDTLFLEHYPGMCEREITDLCEYAKQRWDILNYCVVHRVGELHLGEQIVFVGVSSVHRGDAFAAGEYIIDALKTRAPFWKREKLQSGEKFWVQQRDSDAAKTAEWEENNG